MMEIHMAPMQGYADSVYRWIHARIYGGVDSYYTPFIRIEKGAPRHQDMARLEESLADGYTIVPQIIFNSANEFSLLSDAIRRLGVTRIDLNLGCPYPMQTGKGRGAAMLTNLGVMEEVCSEIRSDRSVRYSVKMRLGMDSPDSWQTLLPILDEAGLDHITLHPRVARQLYAGELHTDQFRLLAERASTPLIWNGDVTTPEGIDAIANEFPALKGVMIGRGLLARPSLAAEWRSGEIWSRERRMEKILLMHSELFNHYSKILCGAAQILQKIKPFWEYLEAEIGHKAYKAIRKASNLDRYRAAVNLISTLN